MLVETDIQPGKIPRAGSRREELLDEAARLFRHKGFHATSVRDIVSAVGMLPGSLYCHFERKEDVLVAVYQAGINEISSAVSSAIADRYDPWARFEAACAAHLEALLRSSDYPQVVVRVLPQDVPQAKSKLSALRDSYEDIFTPLIADLPLPENYDRGFLRRLVIGGLNSTTTWYHPAGDPPRVIARKFVETLSQSLGQSLGT